MKKQIYILFLMVFLCLLSGCSAQKNHDNSADTQISENTDFDKQDERGKEAVENTLFKLGEEYDFQAKLSKEYSTENGEQRFLYAGEQRDIREESDRTMSAAYLINENGAVVSNFDNVFSIQNCIDRLKVREDGIIELHETGAAYFFKECEGIVELIDSQEDYEYSWFPELEKCPEEYRAFMKKVWCSEEALGEGRILTENAFYFTKITDKTVEGQVNIRGHEATPPSPQYYKKYNCAKVKCYFSGTIENGVIEGVYIGEDNEEKKVKMELIDSNYIDVYIDEDEKISYRPLNIKDETSFIQDSVLKAVPIETGYWADCAIIAGVTLNEVKTECADAFIIDKDGNVLYELLWGITDGMKITNIQLLDINNDGLEDIQIDNNYGISKIFSQKENGLFYGFGWYEDGEWYYPNKSDEEEVIER